MGVRGREELRIIFKCRGKFFELRNLGGVGDKLKGRK